MHMAFCSVLQLDKLMPRYKLAIRMFGARQGNAKGAYGSIDRAEEALTMGGAQSPTGHALDRGKARYLGGLRRLTLGYKGRGL